MAKWYCKMGDLEIGPVTAQKLKELAETKRITPDDEVRRDIDADWTLARNVKGLFPEKPAVPVAQAVPVAKVAKTVKVKAVPPPLVADSSQSKILSFGLPTVESAKKSVTCSEDFEMEREKKLLLKKERQRRNFIILASATGGVILLAILILVIVFGGGSDKPKEAESDANVKVAVTENRENAENTEENNGMEGDEKIDDKKTAEDAKSDSESVLSFMPKKWEEAGYKCPYRGKKKNGNYVMETSTFGSMQIAINGVKFKKLVEYDPKVSKVYKKKFNQEFCFVEIIVKNISKNDVFDVPGWGANNSRIRGYKSVQLFDSAENPWRQQRIALDGQADNTMQIGAGGSFTDVLIFNAPNKNTEFLCLVIPALKEGEEDGKIFLPREFFKEEKTVKETENEEGEKEVENAENAEGTDSEKVENAENVAEGNEVESTEPESQTEETLSTDSAPVSSVDGASEPGGLRENLEKTPPPADEELKELDAAVEIPVNALNDAALEY